MGAVLALACNREGREATQATGSTDQIRLPLGAQRTPTSDDGDEAVPDYRESAIPLKERLAQVITYSDRAELVRVGEVKLGAGKHWVEFAELRPGFIPNSVRVEGGAGFQGRIAQVVGEEVYSKGLLSKESKAKLDELKSRYGELLALTQRQRVSNEQLEFVRNLPMEAPFPKSGAPVQSYKSFSANPETLRSAMSEVQERAGELLKKVQMLRAQSADLQLKIQKLEGELKLFENGGPGEDQAWKTRYYVQVESPKTQTATLELRYQVLNALWKPVYDLRAELDRTTGTAELQLLTAGLVEQKTGEDWKNVRLTLSTVDPIPLYLPKLDRWVLKERREEAPEPQQARPQKKMAGAFGRASGALEKKEISAERSELGAMLDEMPASAPPPAAAKVAAQSNAVAPDRKRRAESGARARPQEAEASSLANAVMEDSMSEMDGDAVGGLEQRKDSSPGSALYPMLPLERIYPDLARLLQSASETHRPKARPMGEPDFTAPVPTNQRLSDPMLPAIQAAGRKIEFLSPFAVDVATHASPLKIAVHRQKLRAKLSLFAVPKMDPRVFLRAETTNVTERPILGGSAQIFMDGDLVSKTSLSTINEGGHFQVDLGVDRNVETKRVVERKSKDSSFLGLGKKHATEVEVRIEIANHHAFPIRIEIQDHYPLAPNDQVESKLKTVSPDVPKRDKEDGLLRWKVDVAPNAKQLLRFAYEVVHPENLLVSEFN